MKEKYDFLPHIIPDNWVLSDIGSIGTIVSGGTPSTKEQSNFEGNIAWITPADLSHYSSKFISHGKRNISENGLNSSSAKKMPKGAVLCSSRAPIGYVVISENEISTNQGFKNLIPSKWIFNEYVYHFLKGNKPLLESYASGTTFLEISGKKFSSVPIPLPPLPEQHRIVEKIEEEFTRLDAGVSALKKAKALIPKYRQSVLKAAMCGDLTEEWRAEHPDVENSWQVIELNKCVTKITDGEHFRPKTIELGIPFLSAKDILNSGLSFDKPLYISEETCEKSRQRCNPEKGDILVVSRGAGIGRTCIVQTNQIFCLLGSVILIKPLEIINNKFILYSLQSPNINKQITSISGSTAQQAIYIRDIKKLEIPLPPLEEQHEIVCEIERRFSVIDEIEKAVDDSLAKAERLRQSVLKKAFEGCLVPQNPDDEPASVLLERIRAEKEQRAAEEKARKKGQKELKELKGQKKQNKR